MAVLIHRYTYSLNMASSFAVLLSLTALGFVLFKLAEFADSRIIFWNHDDRMAAVSRRRAAAWKAAGRLASPPRLCRSTRGRKGSRRSGFAVSSSTSRSSPS
jgi:hypothetical protein